MSGDAAQTGVLVMAYGTPADPEQLEAYYTHIRRGRPPTADQLAELRARYEAIGGVSPLLELTRAQVDGIAAELARRGHDQLPIALGFKHAPPFIETAVEELAGGGVERIVGVVLAPHFSALSIGEYAARARGAAAREEQPPDVTVVNDWHLAPPYLELLATSVAEALAALPAAARDGAHVLFTAHSLPARILETDDPYPSQLRETAAAVAELAGLERWDIAWQSAGRTQEPWIGPDVLEVLDGLAAGGASAVVVCPAGFVADHLEVLYDLDVVARARASQLGLPFTRTASPNAAPQLVEAVTDAVLAELAVVTL